MGRKTPLLNDFRSGEMTPGLGARPDLKAYAKGCVVMENCMPVPEGGIIRVPGTRYVRPIKQTEEGWGLRITKSGTGIGVVTDDFGEIDCGAICYFLGYLDGIAVVLTAAPNAGNTFVEWSGDGTGNTTRTVIMNGNKVVNAEFHAQVVEFRPAAIETDGTYLYISGCAIVDGSDYLRVEKRDLNGVLLDFYNLATTFPAYWTSIALDGNDIYVSGYRTGAGQYVGIIHRMSKLNLSSQAWEYAYPGTNYIIYDIIPFGDGICFSGSDSPGAVWITGRVNESDGAQVWEKHNSTNASGGISEDGTYIYPCGHSGGNAIVDRVDPSNGVVISRKTYSTGHLSKGVIVSGEFIGTHLYVAGNLNTLGTTKQAIVQSIVPNGVSQWQNAYPAVPGATTNLCDKAFCDGISVYAVGRVPLTPIRTIRISSHDISDGSEDWGKTHSTDSPPSYGDACEYGDYVYVAGWDNNGLGIWLEKRNKSDGELVWSK